MTNAQDNMKMVKEFTANGYESARQLGDINLRALEVLFEKQMDAFGLLLDTSVKQMEAVTEVKDAKSLVGVQSELAKEFGETLMGKSREAMESAGETREEYRNWYENSVSSFTSKVEEAAKKSA